MISRESRRSFFAGALGLTLLFAFTLHRSVAAPAAPPSRSFGGEVVSRERAEPVLKEARRHVVTVEGLDDKGKVIAFGTGFFVNSNQVATCLHVIDAAARLRLVTADGKRHAVHGIFGTDRLTDSAVLWITNGPGAFKRLQLRAGSPQIPERIFVLAGPSHLPFRAAKGSVTDVRVGGPEFINSAIEFSAPVMPGFSGGPLLDTNGFVVGMASALSLSEERRASIASPVQSIQRLGAEKGRSFAEWRLMEPRLDARFYQSMSAGRALAMQARPLEALKEFENAISICGTNAGAWFGKGQCLLDLERFPAAVAAFQTARELAPEVISTRVMFAKVLQHVGRNVEAAEEARALLQKYPDSLVAHEVLISALASEGEYEQILETAARAERMVSGTPQNRLLQGRLWDTLGCPAAAELAFREALRIQPDNGKAWQELGAAQMDQRKYIEAVTSLSRAFGDPTFKGRSTLRYLVTSVALLNGEADLGEKQFEIFLMEERRTPALHGSSPGIQKAFASLRKRDARRSQTHDLLAKLFLETGRRDEVIPALETSLHLNPTNGSTWLALAQACCMRLRFDRAVDAAGKAIELDPKEGDAHFWLGWAHCALGQPSAARAAFHRAEQLKAAPGRVQLALAGLEMRDGNRTQAERHLGRARQLSPDLPMKFAEDPGKFIQDFRPIERAAAQWLRDRRAAAR